MSGERTTEARRLSGGQLFLIVFAAVFLAVGAVVALAWWWLFPGPFEPVRLDAREQQVLEAKLAHLERATGARLPRPAGEALPPPGERLAPEPYHEDAASRVIEFTERELNALLASTPEAARRMAIDLADDLVSLKLLVPVPEDFPVMAGRTLRVHAGLKVRMREGRPEFVLRGVSVMGVPLPDAWLGHLKNRDLAQATQGGFWAALGEGIESVEVREGRLLLRLRP